MSFKLESISITKLERIKVIGGDVLHYLRSDDYGFNGFGEAYFSFVNFNSVKGWKKHNEMKMNLVCPIGQVKFIFTEDFNEFMEINIGQNNYVRLTVKPKVWFAFKGLNEPYSLLANIANIKHNQNEVERMNLSEVDYSL
tara:strand:+ start:6744 stop:7163 length:420 start_codon:yes stop_codon:yes gene_type:complete